MYVITVSYKHNIRDKREEKKLYEILLHTYVITRPTYVIPNIITIFVYRLHGCMYVGVWKDLIIFYPGSMVLESYCSVNIPLHAVRTDTCSGSERMIQVPSWLI